MEKTQKEEDKQYSSPWILSQEEDCHDVPKQRKVQYNTKWKVIKDPMYWINLSQAQDKGQKIWQTPSNAIILYDNVPGDCIERVVNTRTNEILYQIVSLPPRPPPKNFAGGYQASSTRRLSPAWYQYRETRGGRGKDEAQN